MSTFAAFVERTIANGFAQGVRMIGDRRPRRLLIEYVDGGVEEVAVAAYPDSVKVQDDHLLVYGDDGLARGWPLRGVRRFWTERIDGEE